MPTILRSGPHRFFFFSNEGQEPAHIHVEAGERYAKFWLSPITLAFSIGYTPRELRQLRAIVEQRRDLFQERWHEFFGQE